MIYNIGFISTRISGTDGVSLEINKWANVLNKLGNKCYFYAGEIEKNKEASVEYDLAHFKNPEILEIQSKLFGQDTRARETTNQIYRIKEKLKSTLYDFIDKFKIDLLILENVVSIPLNVPLGIAITEILSETKIPSIAHHHDFFWERVRFLTNCIWEYINMAFPPHFQNLKHVVLNTSASNQLSLRTGNSSIIIPNVMDFENPPNPYDNSLIEFKKTFGIEKNEYIILQPTRVVKRKRIENSIELVERLGLPAKLIISHASGDEGNGYLARIMDFANLKNVKLIFGSSFIDSSRKISSDGIDKYSLKDVYQNCDLVTYPSSKEGFGNAFLESIYFKKPIVINTYSIYQTDIKPKGFHVIEIDGWVGKEAIEKTREILFNEKMRNEMVERNYQIGVKNFSYKTLETRLKGLLEDL